MERKFQVICWNKHIYTYADYMKPTLRIPAFDVVPPHVCSAHSSLESISSIYMQIPFYIHQEKYGHPGVCEALHAPKIHL